MKNVIIEAMKNNTTVTVLKLNNNYNAVVDDCVQPLVEHNTTIQKLYLNATDVTANAFKDLPDHPTMQALSLCYFGNSRRTQMFLNNETLSQNQQGLNDLVHILCQCSQLIKLDLSHIRFLTNEHKLQLLTCSNIKKLLFE